MGTVSDPQAETSPSASGLASWYTPGLVDGFGDRLLMFDNSDTDPLELLRFHSALADAPGFEDILRKRVMQLRRMSEAAFPTVRTVERLEADGTLALVSTHARGRRLSSLFSEPRLRRGLHPAFVTWVLNRTMQPLSILQSEGDDFAHGALTADRVILDPGGRLSIIEHVLGAPLGRLRLPAGRLWKEFGLMTPPTLDGIPKLDARADVFQAGVLALSMLLARRVTPTDLNDRLPILLDECAELAWMRSPRSGDSLRLWLERALQIGAGSYRSAADAFVDLRELPALPEARAHEYLDAPASATVMKSATMLQLTVRTEGQEIPTMAKRALVDDGPFRESESPAAPTADISESVEAFLPESRLDDPRVRLKGIDIRPLETPAPESETETHPPKRRNVSTWVAAALGLIAIVEAGVIVKLSFERANPVATAVAASVVPESGRPGPVAGESSSRGTDASSPSLQRVTAQLDGAISQAAPARDNGEAALAVAASRQRSGGVRLVTPIELKVLEGDRVLGSSADGPIVTSAGTHQLDLINTALGYRSRYTVTFKTGEIAALNVTVPNGRLSVNAQPWAGVWVDGRGLGETPIANIDMPIGEHEIVFRHPQLGEKKQTVVVRADAPTRVSVTFDDPAR